MIALIIQVTAFIAYTTYIYKRFGVLPSISESWYHLRIPGLFTIFCIVIGFPMFFHSRGFNQAIALQVDYTFLFFLSMLLCFTGAATDFKQSVAGKVHFIGAFTSILACLLGVWLQYGLLWAPAGWLISIIALVLFVRNNRIWWAEILSFAWISAGLLTLYL